MGSWISASLALYSVSHLQCFGVSRLVAGRYKTYTIASTVLGFFVSLISLTVVNGLMGTPPSAFIGTSAFYLASFTFSALMLFALGKKLDPAVESVKQQLKVTKNRIAQEGFNAFTSERPKGSNPYRIPNVETENTDYVDYWDRGFILAEKRNKPAGQN